MTPSIEIAGRLVPVWPEGQKVWSVDQQRTILVTRFADCDLYHPLFQERIDRQLADPALARQRNRALGGNKLYRLERWEDPASRLLCARALHLFDQALGVEGGAIDMGWVNVYSKGDYVVAHAHWRSEASVVYLFDEGEPDPEDTQSGLFSFIDPRLELCCQLQPGLMSHPTSPTLRRGSMLIFPSGLVHAVNPYGGRRPRISLSWNINRAALEGDTLTLLGQAGRAEKAG